jgi:hypothetical protein
MKTFTLTLNQHQADVLIEAINEAWEACEHEINMGHDDEGEWDDSRRRYEELEEVIRAQLGFASMKVADGPG